MPLKLDLCTEADMPRAFEIISLAFGHIHAYVEAVWPEHDTPSGRAAGAERLLIAKQTQPWTHLCKVTDTDTGEMVGFAKWDVYDGVVPEVPTSMPEKYYKDDDAKKYAEYIWGEFTRRRWESVRESGGNLVSLDITSVDPKHHRRGAGSLFMQYGTAIADKLGVEAVVEASRMGRYLYENFGFQILEDVLIPNPPKQQGQQEQFIHWMRRPARSYVASNEPAN
ncbi:hypothetical protein K458DRAFT_289798 [Lentithecium fluviatile CBS 122367]|uniref:N-acetyltransferase domain-containing protein n=1 Tax=Lentithecium fluviatile CBS 122367 TaxID=1168545 RepID=A0A6G1JIS7_9PLEO|nr:hypothetical protein K458DRAFT_289798 [Lentithecium fluviatile CBS 122367]